MYCRHKLKGALLDKLDSILDDVTYVCGTNIRDLIPDEEKEDHVFLRVCGTKQCEESFS